ncbi:MAG: methylenetetrahydrofolate reductase [Candidatus Verstraetearchaeota archaeon]|nr:methylenetetrahydrofolate reductase [Candidatus Verstraetearchaeota archaeon]
MGRIFSRLMSELMAGRFVYTGELSPGKSTRLEDLISSATLLKRHVVACNVTDNPRARANLSSLAAAVAVQERAGVEVICQMTARDRNRLALTSDLLGASALGIRNVLVMSGDHPSLGDNPSAMPVYDLDSTQMVSLVRAMVDNGTDLARNRIEGEVKLHVGVTGNPNAVPLEAEVAKLGRKAAVGAEFIQTQAVFGIEVVERFLDAVGKLELPVLVGIMPCRSFRTADYILRNIPGVKISQDYLEALKRTEDIQDKTLKEEKVDEVNEEYFSRMIRELRRTSRVAGVHIMGVNYDRIVGRLVERIGGMKIDLDNE